ncbi:hypothetical protein FHT87_000585 [Rhizobium sp. BK316]|jgi:hypothetical protein|uniref:DUF2934 domain-containing protein n=1 Tax=Rhizobium sp. BK316 TaxID=2587053 RepID=UPI0016131A89|nr:DUF2934 domain-containing protein [Rhizobium sp. BK316]MBB3406685.1 hypothetical protein [Rhizobium sp. BK316]
MAVNEDRLRQRAYEIWEQEGRPHGEDMKHWLQAFQEIAASTETGGQPVKKPRSKKAGEADVAPKVKAAGKSKGGAQSVPTTAPPPKSTKIATGVTKH